MLGRKESDGDNDDAVDFVKKAQQALKRKEYHMAIDLFSQSLCICKSDISLMMRVLEGRASANEQLKDFERAQVDARAMISLQPTFHRGYLRLGKIYRLQGRSEDALRIYSIGMKKTRGHEEIQRQILSTQSRIQRLLFGGDQLDIFKELPTEVMESLLRYLDGTTRMEVLRMSRLATLFKERNKKYHGLARFTIPGSVIVPAVKAIVDSKVDRIYCSSQKAWNLLSSTIDRMPKLKSIHLERIDLRSSIDKRISISLNKLTKLVIRKCVIDMEILNLFKNVKVLICIECTFMGGGFPDLVKFCSEMGQKSTGTIHLDITEEQTKRNFLQYSSPNCYLSPNMNPLIRKQDGLHLIITTANFPMTSLLSMAESLRSIHFITLFNLSLFLSIIPEMKILNQVSIHSLEGGGGGNGSVLDVRRLLDGLMQGNQKVLLSLPILCSLPFERRQLIAQSFPKTRIIFDVGLSQRMVKRLKNDISF